jgi:hypothetical protein
MAQPNKAGDFVSSLGPQRSSLPGRRYIQSAGQPLTEREKDLILQQYHRDASGMATYDCFEYDVSTFTIPEWEEIEHIC